MLMGNAYAKATCAEVTEISGRNGGGRLKSDTCCPHPGSCSYSWVATNLDIQAGVISMRGDSEPDIRKNEERTPQKVGANSPVKARSERRMFETGRSNPEISQGITTNH